MGYQLLIRGFSAEKKPAEAPLVEQLREAAEVGVEAFLRPAPAAAAPPATEATPAAEKPQVGAEAPLADPTRALADAAQAVPPSAVASPSAPAPGAAAEVPASWTILNGDARLTAKLYRVEGEIRGADLEVAFGGTEGELRQALLLALRVANAAGAVVFDPQPSKTVGRGDADDMVGRWRTSQNWLGDVAGIVEDRRGMIEISPPPPLINPRNKILLTIAGAVILVYWIIGTILNLLSD